jgi:hypothetical protein
MAQTSKILWDEKKLISSYTAYRYNDGSKSTSTPNTVTSTATFTYAEMNIPSGAIINWIKFRVEDFASPSHGTDIRNATINGTTIASTINAATDYTITSNCTSGTNSIVIRFKSGTSNTNYPPIPPSTDPNTQANSGTLTWTNVTVVVDYTAESASTLTLSTTTINAGQPVTPTITQGMGSASHKITWQFGTRTQDQTNSDAFTLPLSWLDQIPDANSGLASATLITYNSGGSQIGAPHVAYFTVNVPSSVVPSIGTFSATRVNNDVPSGWEAYVQSKSGVNLDASGSGAYGSTITGWLIQGDGKMASSNVLNITTIMGAGEITFTATVTDSRGRMASKTVTISVLAYSPVSIKSATAIRSTSGGTASPSDVYARVDVSANIASVGGNNSGNLALKYRLKGDTDWTDAVSGVEVSSKVIGSGALEITSAYEIRVTVADTFSSAEQILLLGTATCFVDRLPGQNKLGLFGYVPQGVPEKTLYLPSDGNMQFGALKLNDLFSNPNLLINPDFQVWQRGTIFNTASGYTADRWYWNGGSAPVEQITMNNCPALQMTPAITWRDIRQYIERPAMLSGRTVTMSAKIDNAIGVALSFYIGGDIVFSANADAYGEQTISATATLPSITDSDKVYVCIGNKTNNSSTIKIAWIKLELGSVATPHVSRPYAQELALCQRYALQLNPNSISSGHIGFGGARSTTQVSCIIPVPMTMRVNPSLVYSGVVGNFTCRNGGTSIYATGVTIGAMGAGIVQMYLASTGFTAGAVYEVYWINAPSIVLDAEIYP